MTMAAPRHARKPAIPYAALLALAGVLAAGLPGRAATTEWVVTDRNSGLAIHGFDPVAYFRRGRLIQGGASSNTATPGWSGSSRIRAIKPPLPMILRSIRPGLGAATRSAWPAAYRWRGPAHLDHCRGAALFVPVPGESSGVRGGPGAGGRSR
jgi:hypothetical protein